MSEIAQDLRWLLARVDDVNHPDGWLECWSSQAVEMVAAAAESLEARSKPITLSDEEAAELYRFTRYSYINLTTYPNLMRLLDRVSQQHAEQLTKG